jgi:hypothetical protein
MGWACRTQGEIENAYKILVGKNLRKEIIEHTWAYMEG